MKKSVYIETSVISYLAARPSRNIVAAAWQQVTAEWWERYKHRFNLFISEVVIAEARQGSMQAAAKRLDLIKNIPELEVTDSVETLAKKLLEKGALPKGALDDAMRCLPCEGFVAPRKVFLATPAKDNEAFAGKARRIPMPGDLHASRTHGRRRKWRMKSFENCGDQKINWPRSSSTTSRPWRQSFASARNDRDERS